MKPGDVVTVDVGATRLTVRMTYESERLSHFLVGGADKHAKPATVRVGALGVYACLTCYSGECVHVRAARLADGATEKALTRSAAQAGAA